MTDERDLTDRADTAYCDWWRVWATSVAGGSVREAGGLLLAATGAPQEWWNVAAVTRPLDDPPAAIREAIDHFRGLRQPFILRIRDGLDPDAERAAGAAGLRYTDTLPGMVLQPVPPVPPAPPALEIRRVTTPDGLAAYAEVAARAFEQDAATTRRLLPMRLLEHPRWRSYLGYVDGRPAACSSLLVTDGVAGIYFVGTLPEYRRRGYGEALTWHAVREGAAAGSTLAVLQASELGQPVYARMGFRVTVGYKTFVLPQILAGRGWP